MKHEVLHGDCIEVMRSMEPDSVDAIVTDPPYGLGFMGKKWDALPPGVDVFAECLRVLKPGGHLLAFGGSRTYHRLAVAVEDAGFEVRDQIMWVYGSGFPKSMNVSKAITAYQTFGNTSRRKQRQAMTGDESWSSSFGSAGTQRSMLTGPTVPPAVANLTEDAKQWEGWGTALKPAHEPIVLARKPLVGTVASNVLEYGTGALNIDGTRVGGGGQLKWSEPRGGGYNGGYKDKQGAATENTLGRWPANLIHDGTTEATQHMGQAAKYFYSPKASKKERNAGLEDLPLATAGEVTNRQDGSAGLNSPRAGAGRTSGSRNTHPTVKPVGLMRYLVRLVTPPEGVVLDPFAGSGSTGVACVLEGVSFVGVEREVEYVEIATKRIQHHAPIIDPA